MTLIITLLGILIILLCAWGILKPKEMLQSVLNVWNRPSGVYLAISIRIALGVIFILAAEQTRYPDAIRILGYLMVVAALAIMVAGRERTDRFINWWKNKGSSFLRIWLVFGVIFGAFLVFATI